MTEVTQYECDLSGEVRDRSGVAKVVVKKVKGDSQSGVRIINYTTDKTARHVCHEELGSYGFPAREYLTIVVAGTNVVGYIPHDDAAPDSLKTTMTTDQRNLLREIAGVLD